MECVIFYKTKSVTFRVNIYAMLRKYTCCVAFKKTHTDNYGFRKKI